MKTLRCDVAVIGAGTAGLAAERTARQAGAKTLLIDEQFAGTTCASVGCMPSKLLIAAAEAAHAVSRAPLFGLATGTLRIDGPAVMSRVRSERDRFVAGAKKSIAALPDGVALRARAHFVGANTLKLDDGRMIEATAIVVATGSRPDIPRLFQPLQDAVLTNETVFELQALPSSLAVVGAGPLGLELAQAFCRLGVEVRVLDASAHLAAVHDAAIAKQVVTQLGKEFSLTLDAKLEHAKRVSGGIELEWTGAVPGSEVFECVLLAAGRPPALSHLNLESAGIELDGHGVPTYDKATLQCGASCIFIAGDADHDRPVLHEASAEGTIAGRNAARFPSVSPATRFTPLAITFTDPQLAVIGAVPAPDATDVVIGCASYADQGRARAFGRNQGLVHVYADAAQGVLRGATLFGPAVEHTAHLIAWAIQQKMSADAILQMPFYHPTYEEGLKTALRSICEAVNVQTADLMSPGE